MQLDAIRLVLRRRTGWEAIDLGGVMLRAWGGAAYRAWIATYVPFALLVLTVIGVVWPDHLSWASILVWWCKPAFDRVLLFVYSRALFGERSSVRDVWRAFPGLLRNSGLLRALTIGRFSMARSFLLPVWQLEGSSGKATRARARVLGRITYGYASWLTFFCANVSAVLVLSALPLLLSLLPEGSVDFIGWRDLWLGGAPVSAQVLWFLAAEVAETIVEPFYVASGFSLYLSRRTELEGWDIELGLRQLARRKTEEAPTVTLSRPARVASLAAALACCLAFSWPVPSAHAADAGGNEANAASAAASSTASSTTPEPKPVITEILTDPVFGKKVQDWRWQRRDKDNDREEKDGAVSRWLKALWRLTEFIAQGLRALVWVAGILLLAAIIYLVWRTRDYWQRGGGAQAPPERLFGLDVRPESLPDDVPAAARALLKEGQLVAVLALLYRASLSTLIHRAHVEFRPGDTEGNCLDRVQDRIEPDAFAAFTRLLRLWQLAAYAHRPPAGSEVESLIDVWARHFSLAARLAAPKAARP